MGCFGTELNILIRFRNPLEVLASLEPMYILYSTSLYVCFWCQCGIRACTSARMYAVHEPHSRTSHIDDDPCEAEGSTVCVVHWWNKNKQPPGRVRAFSRKACPSRCSKVLQSVRRAYANKSGQPVYRALPPHNPVPLGFPLPIQHGLLQHVLNE